jgi:hypothetical protein
MAPTVEVRAGAVHLLFAYDIGQWIDLPACARMIKDATEPARIEHRGNVPSYFQYDPPPLRVVQRIAPMEVGGRRTTGSVETVLFDFGAVSVRYEVPLEGSLEDVAEYSCRLEETSAFAEDAVRRIDDLIRVVGSAVQNLHFRRRAEDYLVFRLRVLDRPLGADELVRGREGLIARILRGERGELSLEEVEDAVGSRISYARDDVTLVDWRAAVVVAEEAEDVRSVLEFANVQLVEMTYLDDQLDGYLDRIYEALAVGGWRPFGFAGTTRADLKRVARMQVDSVILYERITNALKLLGDQYLARLYRLVAKRFHLGEWDASLLRKLETIESLYGKLFDRASTNRMELLEWLIILLFVVSIVLPLLH